MTEKLRLNHQIRATEVRVTRGPETGVMSHDHAMRVAVDNGMDLIEVSHNASPPACIIEELGKWKFDQAKKAKANKQTRVETKVVQLRPVTDPHDLGVKAKAAIGFLTEGHRVRVVVRFRGRELAHPEVGTDVLQGFANLCTEAGLVDGKIGSLEGKQMAMLMVPRKK